MDNQEKTTEEILNEKFESLPKNIKSAILKSKWQNEVRKIASRYYLRVDQENLLENNILMLMLGLQDVDGFFEEMGKEIEDDLKLNNILEEVEQTIFAVIKEYLVEDTQEKESNKSNYLKDEVEGSAMDDEILTVTRDEILKGIEESEKIQQQTNAPELKSSNVMQTDKPKIEESKPVDPVEAGLGNKISTSAKDYKSIDPYREPLE